MTSRLDNEWSDGQYLYAADLNDSFDEVVGSIENKIEPLSNMDITDNTVVNDSRSRNSGVGANSYATKRTLDVGAGTVNNYLIIMCDLECISRGNGNSPLQGSGKLQITVDSVQKFEVIMGARSDDNDSFPTRTRNCVFKYEPSSSEKSNGFTVDLDLAATISDASGGSYVAAYNHSWAVFYG